MNSELSRDEALRYIDRLGLSLPMSARVSPAARREALPTWLTPEFIATPAARQKLEAWIDAGQPRALSAVDMLTTMDHSGDELLAHVVARTLAAMPDPLATYVVRSCELFSIGFNLRGSCSPPLPGKRPWLLTFSSAGDDADTFESIVRHEVCHAWLLAEPKPGTACPASFVSETIRSTAVPPEHADMVQAIRRTSDRNERQCIALVHALGWTDPSDLFPVG